MNRDPIFIVGIPRSGTTLLAAMLAAHSKMSCGPETHFFRWLSKVDPDQLIGINSWPTQAVDFISSITHNNYISKGFTYLIEKHKLTKNDIEEYLKKCDPSIPIILSSVTEQYMRMLGKTRWIEKTPDHLKFVQEIRKYFPTSPILRIIRDPRDVALSLVKLPWGTKTYFQGVYLWKNLMARSEKFFSSDKYSYTIRYEDLISDPQTELEKLCNFIGENYEEQMLDTSITGRQINTRDVPWKDKSSKPIDLSRKYAWQNEISQRENQLTEALLGDQLEVYGYIRKGNFLRFCEFYPSFDLPVRYVEQLYSIASSGFRFWKMRKNEKANAIIFWGDPGSPDWLGQNRSVRFLSTISVSKKIIQARLAKKQLFWIPEKNEREWSGYFSSWLKKLLYSHQISLMP